MESSIDYFHVKVGDIESCGTVEDMISSKMNQKPSLYRAPETNMVFESDIYSLGIILWEVILLFNSFYSIHLSK